MNWRGKQAFIRTCILYSVQLFLFLADFDMDTFQNKASFLWKENRFFLKLKLNAQ